MKDFRFLLITLSAIFFSCTPAWGGRASETAFNMVRGGRCAAVVYDAGDALAVARTAGLFADDVLAVTGIRPEVIAYREGDRLPSEIVLVGSIEGSRLLKKVCDRGKMDLSEIRGDWERYMIETVKAPLPGVRKALIVAGSDRRGAAFGLFSISERIGVSPWSWWADVPVRKSPEIILHIAEEVSESPSVKYRGIFLNDEDWGLKPWAEKTFEPEVGNIGPKTYAKVCELLLRLKANYLCPAMHEVSTAFNRIPENKMVADTFAIVMGSTHCEPLLFNTATEWDRRSMGAWNYDTNKETILTQLTKRVQENSAYENVYTLALRGLHDAVMAVGTPMKDKVKMLQEALMDQRRILEENIDRPIEEIPQAFTPYKEVLEIYSNGIELPDDVTIVWPDDNYGYFKRLSGVNEQKRSGRSGVYYHVSYLGVPHSYLWFSTTPPALMYEELRKAYDTTADRLWLCNCGDIKGCEMQVSLFLDMAYDIDRFDAENVVSYPARWLSGFFGAEHEERFDRMYREFIRLAFPRKPEYMGWGFHWNHFSSGCEQLTDTQFSFSNYSEAQDRIYAYRTLSKEAEEIMETLPEEFRPAFFQLAYYPFKGAELLNRMTLGGQMNREYAREGRAAASRVARQVRECHDSLHTITAEYNSLSGGKWANMMSVRQNYDWTSAYFKLPHLEEPVLREGMHPGIRTEGDDVSGVRAFHSLPVMDSYMRQKRWIEIFNRGTEEFGWKAEVSEEWLRTDRKEGVCREQDRINVSVDWDKVPLGEHLAEITIRAGGKDSGKEWSGRIFVSVLNPATPARDSLAGIFVQSDGHISIPAGEYHRKRDNADVKICTVPDLGIEGEALMLGSPVAPLQCYRDGRTPTAEYDFYCFDAGMVDVYTYALPTFPLHGDRDFRLNENTNTDTKYSIQIDGGAIATPTTSHTEYTQMWFESVLRNFVVNKSVLYIDKPGKHTLKIRTGDPGIVLQKIVMDFGGLRRSYLGPSSTKVE